MDDAIDRRASAHAAACGRARSRPNEALRMSAPDGAAAGAFRQGHAGDALGQGRAGSDTLAERWGAERACCRPGASASQRCPLTLISPASDKRISSTARQPAGLATAPPLMMHPADAAARGSTHGADVRVWNELARSILPLAITDAVRPGVVASEKGAWIATSPHRADDLRTGLGGHAGGLVGRRLLQRHAGPGRPDGSLERSERADRHL